MPKCRVYCVYLSAFLGLLILADARPVAAQSILRSKSSGNTASILSTQPAPPAQPESVESAPVISDIRVEGTERIESDTVVSYLTLAKGDKALPDKLDASLKALYATGLFSDVNLAMEGSTLVVKVAENPVINRVVFEGNDAISKDDLEKEVQLKPRLVYTLPRVQKDVQRILDLYRRQGRFAAEVDPKLVKLEQNRVDLIFEITEGKRTGIRSINFVGNEHYSASALRQAISTRESAWWRIFSNTDYYDPDRLNYDRELLRRFYLNQGYVDFRVLSAVAELTPDREDFFITFTVEEGQRYKFGKIDIKSEIKGLDVKPLYQYLNTHQGEWYSADEAEKSITKLTTVLGDQQYAFVNITPDIDRHKDTRTVDLTYDIKPGEREYVGRIEISGNTRTVDKVIRREMQLAEGDPFSATKLHQSEQRLKDLGFFDDVKITPVPGDQPDRTDLKVSLKEKPTGEVSIGGGFSSTDGPLGDFSIHEKNFMGEGQDARIGATVSPITTSVDTSFTDPYFMGRNLSAGADLFYTASDFQIFSSYNVDSVGMNLRVGYPLSDRLRQKLNYTFHEDTISNVPGDATLFIQDQVGSYSTSAAGQELTYDTRDSKLNPTLGYLLRLNSDVAGLGGSRRWVRLKVGGTQYYPLDEDANWILSGTAEAGEIKSLSGPTLISERYFLGDETFRGFQYAGIGPRDITDPNQDALGGNRFTRGTIDLATPTPFPPEIGLQGHLFTDVGTLGDTPLGQAPSSDVVATDESLHLSAGFGVTWNSPFGPVRLDFAEPLIYKTYDKLQHIHFNFGTTF